MLLRFVWVSIVAIGVLAGSAAHALDHTTPKVRYGASLGLFGSLPVGADADTEFDKALWVHMDAVSFDIGEYAQLNAFFRLSVAGGYDPRLLRESLDQARLPDRDMQDAIGVNMKSREALVGLSGRVFPLGEAKVRPFVSLGLGLATAGASFNAIPASAQGNAEQRAKQADEATYRHLGMGLALGLGVRFDPAVPAFGEEWVLPILVELSYVKNFWLGVRRSPEYLWQNGEDPMLGSPDPALQLDASDLAGKNLKADFLGLLVTFGFLR